MPRRAFVLAVLGLLGLAGIAAVLLVGRGGGIDLVAGRLGLVDGLVGRRLLAALAGDDRLDEVGLAQAAEAVDAQLAGEQVKVGERTALEGVAGEHGQGGILLWGRWDRSASGRAASAAGDSPVSRHGAAPRGHQTAAQLSAAPRRVAQGGA